MLVSLKYKQAIMRHYQTSEKASKFKGDFEEVHILHCSPVSTHDETIPGFDATGHEQEYQ